MFRVHTSMSMEVARPKKQGEYDIDGGSGSLKNMEKNFVKKCVHEVIYEHMRCAIFLACAVPHRLSCAMTGAVGLLLLF